MTNKSASASLTFRTIFVFWLPLALSWLLMSTEMPTVTAFIARMPQAKLQLAAFGVATSLALAIESPIVSLLTASNAVACDRDSFRLMYCFMIALNVLVTLAMLGVSLTPLFDLIVVRLMGTPPEIARLVRPVLLVMTTWPPAIGYRRFLQGIMVRRGYTRQMTYGTAIRLGVALLVAALGLWSGRLDGATAGGLALAFSTLSEAMAVHFWSRRAVRQVKAVERAQDAPPLSLADLLRFYGPLTLTSFINLSTTPLLNLGMTRALHPVESLAVWPVINGQLFVTRSFGYSLQEVVVALLNRPEGMKKLRQFAIGIGTWSLLLMGIVVLTPVGSWWQREVAGLNQELAGFALGALRLTALLPLLATIQSWFRGLVVFGRRTGAIAQATAINLIVLAGVLLVGVQMGTVVGASLSAVALTVSQGIESLWLWRNARLTQRKLNAAQIHVPASPG
ncbi:MAG: hypothetical protein JW934_17760 [Anaerolineae bacterium]|nr:hypothetical protein [Anaerolineae bacterium]